MVRAAMVTAVLLLLTVLQSTAAELPPPQRSYNILMLLPISSKSHRNVFMPLAAALADRGHKITMLSNHSPPPDQNPNIRHLQHGLEHFNENSMNMFEMMDSPDEMFEKFRTIFPLIGRKFYDVPVVAELYDQRHKFDLFLVDSMFNEVTYPFLHERAFISVATALLDPALSAATGNVLNPAYVANMIDEYPRPFSFVNRVKNIFFSIMVPTSWSGSVRKPVEIELQKRFSGLPRLQDIERNQSLTLINSHFSLGTPLPLLPGQVEIGGMHLRPAKPLPKDILELVSGQTPVIYMSLGSVVRSSTMPEKYKSVLLKAFAKLPYKVIWKFEEQIDNLPKNVIIKKWLPQQDILGHPNVKVFISHCGMLGSQEAMYHSTPILALPLFGDQPKNARYLQNIGVARVLPWQEMTEQIIIDNIQQLVTNPSYFVKLSEISARFRDQPESPVERAVFWTEYVVRHQGALHLRSPEWYLSWIEILHLDIVLAVHLLGYIIYKTLKAIFGFCCGSSSAKKTTKKTKNKRE